MKIKQKGFTLIELIIVIAIIALLAAATFVAVNPAKRIGDANNAQRWSDISAIADAWNLYVADNNGTAATTSADCITANTTCQIANYAGTDTGFSDCAATTTAAFIWLDPLVDNGYLAAVPADPLSSTAVSTSTGYYFLKDDNGALTIGACDTYNGETIKVLR